MQTLKGYCSFLDLPQLEFELSSPFTSRRSRLKNEIWCSGMPFSPATRSPLALRLVFSSNSRESKVGFSSDSSVLKCFLAKEPRKGAAFGTTHFTLAWEVEQQAIGDDEISEEDCNSSDGSSQKLTDQKHGFTSNGELKKSEEEEEEDGRIDVLALAKSLVSAKTADDVKVALHEMKELPLPVYSSIIRGFGIDKRLEPAMALVEWLKKKKKESDGSVGPNLYIYNSLLGAIKQTARFELLDEVMKDMADEGIVPNVVTYNTLMSIHLEQNRTREALALLDRMQEMGLSPSPVSYSTALLAYRRMEDGNGALKFYQELREKYQNGEIDKDSDDYNWETEFINLDKFITKICYQVMRRWLVKGHNSSAEVLKLLADMDEAQVKHGRAEYERLMWACTREEHYVVAKELYKRIRDREAEISLSVCNHVIWLMGRAKKWWAALEIYEDLLDKGPKPNNLSYELILSNFNVLLTAARKRGTWKWGVRLLNKMEEKGLKPGSKQWNAVLVACSKASETSAAVQIFRRMVEQGERPTILSYGALLSALEKGRLYEEAIQVWEHMVKVGVEPNLYAYTIMASVYIGQSRSEMVESLIQEMVGSGIEPTTVTFNAIISGCSRNGMAGTAFEWFNRMKVQNVMPNEITYETMVETLAKDGKPRLAYEMYLRAQNEGFKLSLKAYDAVIDSSESYGVPVEVRRLGSRPQERRKKVTNIRSNLSEFCKLADVPRRSKPFEKEEVYIQQTLGSHSNK